MVPSALHIPGNPLFHTVMIPDNASILGLACNRLTSSRIWFAAFVHSAQVRPAHRLVASASALLLAMNSLCQDAWVHVIVAPDLCACKQTPVYVRLRSSNASESSSVLHRRQQCTVGTDKAHKNPPCAVCTCRARCT